MKLHTHRIRKSRSIDFQPKKEKCKSSMKPDLLHNTKANKIFKLIGKLSRLSKDTLQFENKLLEIKDLFRLKFIKVDGYGTPNVKVTFQINPIYQYTLPNSSKMVIMTGRGKNPETKVNHYYKELTIGTIKAYVGHKMIANPLTVDHEAGSTSSSDTTQNNLMKQLFNSGKTSVETDKKYIKGHLLNDNIGGQGQYYNLFPITAKANSDHLVYVEKYIKAQVDCGAVVFYQIDVDHEAPVKIKNSSQYYINSKFKFKWGIYNIHGNVISTYENHIDSICNVTNNTLQYASPFDVSNLYLGRFNKFNKGKASPDAIISTDQKICKGKSVKKGLIPCVSPPKIWTPIILQDLRLYEIGSKINYDSSTRKYYVCK